MSILLFIAGLLFILGGANFMTDGASAIARKMGLSDFIVGLTIVSMMTSAPELVVSLTSAFNHSSGMAVGNIVGSNIFNILVIVGVSAMIKSIRIEGGILVNEIPLVILSSGALLTIGCSPLLDGTPMTVTRVDGILLLLFFLIFMRFTIAQAKKGDPAQDPKPASAAGSRDKEKEASKKQLSVWLAIVYLVGGLVALILGGDWFVDGASGIARSLGMSEAMIGLTIIAAGTSLPELATSVVAAVKGSPGICIGNVIGSNIFNIFFVLGMTATVLPLGFGGIGLFDLLVLMAASLLFWIVGWFGGYRTIKRSEGLLLFLIYVAYITALCLHRS